MRSAPKCKASKPPEAGVARGSPLAHARMCVSRLAMYMGTPACWQITQTCYYCTVAAPVACPLHRPTCLAHETARFGRHGRAEEPQPGMASP